MADFVINLNELGARVGASSGAAASFGVDERSFEVTSAWVDRELTEAGVRGNGESGALNVRVHPDGVEFLVEGTLRASLVAECARCLEDVPVAVDTSLHVLFAPGSLRHVHAASENDDVNEANVNDPDIEYYAGAALVLDTAVREHLLLEVPMKPLCDESCEGIKIPGLDEHNKAFEEAKQQDSRLNPLGRLKELLAKSEEKSSGST